jgi:hypothetical protein
MSGMTRVHRIGQALQQPQVIVDLGPRLTFNWLRIGMAVFTHLILKTGVASPGVGQLNKD